MSFWPDVIRRRLLPLAAVIAAAFACAAWWPQIRNEFFVLAGNRDEAGGYYGFHSGIGGAAYISLPVFLAAFWFHHQCGVSGCYWYARRTTAAGERACWRHVPDRKRTHRDMLDAHEAALKRPDQI
jgi:hypothetical protein